MTVVGNDESREYDRLDRSMARWGARALITLLVTLLLAIGALQLSKIAFGVVIFIGIPVVMAEAVVAGYFNLRKLDWLRRHRSLPGQPGSRLRITITRRTIIILGVAVVANVVLAAIRLVMLLGR